MAKVNLDALIPREDFEVQEVTNPGKKKETISIEDIQSNAFFFSNLRKPDFQRETNEWDAGKVVELIRSFVSGDLIPAVILWRSTAGYLFVIDGSHRLSALAAWVQDDYGDGDVSKQFYDGTITDEQRLVATETRKLIAKTVGTYRDLQLAISRPDKVEPHVVKYAKNLAALAIQLQWVEGDATKAENSFFKINQQAAPIDKTELRLLEDRRKPSSIAARAIIRSGRGHKYWSYFPEIVQAEVQSVAAEINELLFDPALETPVRTLDLPVAGRLYAAQTLPLIVDMIGVITDGDQAGGDEDKSGERTLDLLKRVRRVAWLLNSSHASSLGLHPAIYFYSAEGRHKSASFLAVIDLMLRLQQRQKLPLFIKVRERFEQLCLSADYIVQQINRRYRIAQKSYTHISKYYENVIELLASAELTDDQVLSQIASTQDFSYLSTQKPVHTTPAQEGKFDKDAKSAIYIRTVLQSAPKCAICSGYVHKNSVSFDHATRRREGGLSSPSNGQLSHPYCNTGIKA